MERAHSYGIYSAAQSVLIVRTFISFLNNKPFERGFPDS